MFCFIFLHCVFHLTYFFILIWIFWQFLLKLLISFKKNLIFVYQSDKLNNEIHLCNNFYLLLDVKYVRLYWVKWKEKKNMTYSVIQNAFRVFTGIHVGSAVNTKHIHNGSRVSIHYLFLILLNFRKIKLAINHSHYKINS